MELKDVDLQNLTNEQLKDYILKLRNAIRKHRDAKQHERCWLNDKKLYDLLPETEEADFKLPPQEEFLKNCYIYWQGCMFKENAKNFDKLNIKEVINKLLCGQSLSDISNEMGLDRKQLISIFEELN